MAQQAAQHHTGLSAGSIHSLMSGLPTCGPYVFQVLNMKAVMSKTDPNAKKRYRINCSDGLNYVTMMLAHATNSNGDDDHEIFPDFTIIKALDCIVNEVGGRRVVIILSMERIGHHPTLLGAPTLYTETPGAKTGQDEPPVPGGGPPRPLGPANGGPGPAYGGPPPQQGGAMGGGPAYGGAPAGGPQQQYGSSALPQGAGGYSNQNQPAGTPQQGGGYGGGGGGGCGGGYGGGGGGGPPPGAMGGGYGGGGVGGGGGGGAYGRPGGSGGSAAPPPQYCGGGGGATARNDAPLRIVGIKSLNPFTGRWTIKAKCTSKAELRRWSGVKGDGKLFSFDLLDSGGGEIRCTAFNDQVDKFFDVVQVGSIYTLSKCSLKHKKPQFNSTNHDFEIQLERDSVMELCPEDDESRAIPDVLYNFRPISDIGGVEAGAMLDICGIVESVDNWMPIMRKNGEETRKRSMIVRDKSNVSVELTMWGAMTSDPGDMLHSMVQAGERPVLAIKNARVGDFNGKTLSTIGSSVLRIRPAIPQAAELQAWYDAGGSSERPTALSSVGGGGGGGKRTTVMAIKAEDLGHGEKPDWITVPGSIIFIRQDPKQGSSVVYPSCPGEFNSRSCSKKLTEGGGQWYCERCAKYYSEPVWRYLVSLQLSDHTAMTWLTCFGESGEIMFDGMRAPDLKALEYDNQREFDKRVGDANFNRMVFRLKVAEDTYQDEARVKVSVFKMEPMDYVKECKLTLEDIGKLEAGVPILQARADAPAAGAGANPYAAPAQGGYQQRGPTQQQQQQRGGTQQQARGTQQPYNGGGPPAGGWGGGGGGQQQQGGWNGGGGAPQQQQGAYTSPQQQGGGGQQGYGGGGGGGGWGGQQQQQVGYNNGPPQQQGGYNSGPPPQQGGGGGGYGGGQQQQQGGWNGGQQQGGGGGGGYGGGGAPPGGGYNAAPPAQQGGGYGGAPPQGQAPQGQAPPAAQPFW